MAVMKEDMLASAQDTDARLLQTLEAQMVGDDVL
jgi:hypothetical protein